tara:strand:- start:71 stop:532 length:462 start_codon:yes stop_codon:yes gene_type:complete
MILFIQYILVTIIVFAGLIAGTIISKLAIEELKIGKKWFTITKNGLAAIALGALLIKFHIAIPIIITIALFTLLTFKPAPNHWLYIAASVFLPISASNDNIFFAQATLIFLLGTVIAALSYNQKKKFKPNLKLILKEHVYFLIIAVLFYFILY